MPTNGNDAEAFDAIVVGGGQSGLAQSFFLKKAGLRHVVLERNCAFSAWYQRWDSLRMNTPNWMNSLPGAQVEFCPGARRTAFGTREDAIRYFEHYVKVVEPPLREHVEVRRVCQSGEGTWQVETRDDIYRAPNVVICTGQMTKARIPSLANDLPPNAFQLHASEYRNPAQLPDGNVLVVGSGSSGVQICEELAKSQRFKKLHLAVSGNHIFPWTILGIPSHSIAHVIGLNRIERNSWLGRRLRGRLEATGDVATPPSPAQLSRIHSVELLGRVTEIADGLIRCADGKTVPLDDLATLWCTGFGADYGFIEVDERDLAFEPNGEPRHERGIVAAFPGLYFVGVRFQHTPVSHLIHGAGDDARFIAEHIVGR